MIRAALLDLDGTLVRSVRSHARAYVAAFAESGIEADEREAARLVGLVGKDLVVRLAPDLSKDARATIVRRKGEIWAERFAVEAIPMPGARDLLLELARRGLRIVLATSARTEERGALLSAGGLRDLDLPAVGADEVFHPKPAPDVFLAAARRAGVTPDECVAIGDTPFDMASSGTAGCRRIGIAASEWSPAELREAGAEETYLDLATLLRSSSLLNPPAAGTLDG